MNLETELLHAIWPHVELMMERVRENERAACAKIAREWEVGDRNSMTHEELLRADGEETAADGIADLIEARRGM